MRVIAVLAVLCLAFLAGCSSPQETPEAQHAEEDAAVAETPEQETPAVDEAVHTYSIPSDVSYTLIDSDVMRPVKRSLTVRLNKKVSEDVLREIATELKGRDHRSYDRTFITYYLPDMAVGSGAWATTHFDPDLEVKILGLTSEQEEQLRSTPTPQGRTVLGEWVDERAYVGSRITLYRESGDLHIEFAFHDGSVWDNEVRERSSSLGRRFDPVEYSPTGDHWVVDSSGKLHQRDDQGLIAICQKAK